MGSGVVRQGRHRNDRRGGRASKARAGGGQHQQETREAKGWVGRGLAGYNQHQSVHHCKNTTLLT